MCPSSSRNPCMTKLELESIVIKPGLSLLIALPIGVVLAVLSSLLLNKILHDHGLAGALGGIFASGVFNAIGIAILGGILFGYTLAFKQTPLRISAGVFLGILVGAWFAHSYRKETSADLLGIGFFLGYGSVWGALGGGLFAAVVRPVFRKVNLTPDIHLPFSVSNRVAVLSSIAALLAAFVPIVFSKSEFLSPDGRQYIVVASSSECKIPESTLPRLRLPPNAHNVRVALALNGKYGLVIGDYSGPKARSILTTYIRRGTIPRDSFLLSGGSIVKDFVTCP